MTWTTTLTERASDLVERRTSRRGFLGRTAVVGSALTVAGPTYVLRPGSAYAAVTRLRCGDCGSGLCCDGYTEFCCHVYPDTGNGCPPGTLLAGWWKVDNSDFCFGTARYYMDCNKATPACSCGSSGACQDDYSQCGCTSCDARKDGCTAFRYGNCNNQVACVGPIMCRVVTCTKPWEIESTCSTVPRTDERTRHHHRPCLERDPTGAELAFVEALYHDFLGRGSDPSGQAYWGNLMVRGAHLDTGVRDVIAYSFAYSEEYAGVVVTGLYRTLLDRDPEPDGRHLWVDQLLSGMTPQELAVELSASDEFYWRAGEDDAGFVRRLYRKILERAAAQSEVDYWVGVLGDGTPRDDVAEEIYGSVESRRIRVRTLYQRFLARDPERDGRDYWVDVLGTHEDISLAVFLVASQEYYDRAGRRFPPEPS